MKRGGALKRYAPLRQVSARKRREQRDENACRDAVKERSGGYCEGRAAVNCTGVGVHMHHVWPEDRDAGLHDPARCRWLCAPCHFWTHNFPHDAKKRGLLRSENAS